MSEIMIERIRENLTMLKMKHTLEILDNYLERAVKDSLNIIEVLEPKNRVKNANERLKPKYKFLVSQ
jgi:DNA replication protein DnaC